MRLAKVLSLQMAKNYKNNLAIWSHWTKIEMKRKEEANEGGKGLSEKVGSSVTSKKSPNVFKSCPKMISLAKWKISTTLQILLNNVGEIILATDFEKLPKMQ